MSTSVKSALVTSLSRIPLLKIESIIISSLRYDISQPVQNNKSGKITQKYKKLFLKMAAKSKVGVDARAMCVESIPSLYRKVIIKRSKDKSDP